MSDWTSGYVTDIDYPHGYCAELNPWRIRLAFLGAGLAFPEVATACELGFGQGLSVNLHAAGSSVRWYGTDFNPAQAGLAHELASASGAGAQLVDQAFEEFCARADLPDFDYIGLHGVWSWVSEQNRGIIVDFIRRKLRVGGVLYVGYNTQPGWASMVPVRELLLDHGRVMGVAGRGLAARIDEALRFASRLFEASPSFASAHPQVLDRLAEIRGEDRRYLAHEYFNRDWHPMSVARMAERLADAKLELACSANYLSQLHGVNLTAEQQALIEELPDTLFREVVRDFMMNRPFRRDYWVKGARRLTAFEQAERLREERVILDRRRDEVSLEITGLLGKAVPDGPAYGMLLDALSDHRPRSIGELEQGLCGRGVELPQIVEAVIVMCGAGALSPAQGEALVAAAAARAERLNIHLLRRARGNDKVNHLASPVTGGGVPVDRIQQLFLLARASGRPAPDDWASEVWDLLDAQGQRLFKDGRPLETPAENLAELKVQAHELAERRLPVLRGLQVVP